MDENLANGAGADTGNDSGAAVERPATLAEKMAESIGQNYADIQERDDTGGGEKTIKDAPPAREKTEQPRSNGKFAKAPAEGAAGAPAGASGADGAAAQPAAVHGRRAPDLTRPPAAWTPAAKAKWDALPPEIRAEAHKREEDMLRGVEHLQETARFGAVLEREIRPFEGMIRAAGTDAPRAVGTLLQVGAAIYFGTPQQKAQALMAMAAQAGLDLRQLGGMAQNAQPQGVSADPAFQQLQRQNAELHAKMTAQERRAHDAAYQSSLSLVQQFGSDPKNRYFDNVQADMVRLIERGAASSLEQAYTLACNANPEIRSLIESEARAAWEKEQRDATTSRANDARRKAGINVRHSPTGTAPTQAKGNWKDGIKTRYAELQAEGNT